VIDLSRTLVSAVIVALAAAPIAHAASAGATTSATIFKPMAVTAAAQMSFGRLQYNGKAGREVATVVLSAAAPATRTSADAQLLPNGGETPAVRNITGEPGRAYRVTVSPALASPGGLAVDDFRIWSANSGDITARSGMLGPSGTDTIRIGATLWVPRGTKNDVYTALPTINIAYE
jgi:hypothetical protein